MLCPFCNSVNSQSNQACSTCGGPLRPSSRTAPTPARDVPTPVRKPAPILPPVKLPSLQPTRLAHKVLEKNSPPIVAVGFHPSENEIITLVLEDGSIQGWDRQNDGFHHLSSGRALRKSSPVCCAAFASSQGRVLTGHQCGQVRWHNLTASPKCGGWNRRGLECSESHLGSVLALATTTDHLYSAGSDGTILMTKWPTAEENSKTHLQSQLLLDGLSAMSMMGVSSDAQLLACGNDDGTVQMWRLAADGEETRLDWTSRKHLRIVKSLTFAPNGHSLISRDAAGRLYLWSARTGYELPLAPEAQFSGATPAFAADSRLLATTSEPCTVAIFDTWTGALRYKLPPTKQEVQHLVIVPNINPNSPVTLLIAASSHEITGVANSLAALKRLHNKSQLLQETYQDFEGS